MTLAQAGLREGLRRNVLDQEHFNTFREANLAGFSPSSAFKNSPWLFSLDPLQDYTSEFEVFEDTLNHLENVALIMPMDICGMTPETMEDCTVGLANGLRGLFEAVLTENGLLEDIIIPLRCCIKKLRLSRGQASEAFFEARKCRPGKSSAPFIITGSNCPQ